MRASALSALEGLDDPRSIDLALQAIADPDGDVVIAAVGVLRSWLTRETGASALDALTALALDRARDQRVRLAALDALSELPRELVQPVLERAAVPAGPPLDDPVALRDWIARRAADAPLSELHDIIVRAREREQVDASARRRQEWLATRGAAHAALSRRDSRVALYDLREAFDAATSPLPIDFLTAITQIGDASCLVPMAQAWAASAKETWWRERLQSAADEIMHRTRLSGRSAVMKRLRANWPGFL